LTGALNYFQLAKQHTTFAFAINDSCNDYLGFLFLWWFGWSPFVSCLDYMCAVIDYHLCLGHFSSIWIWNSLAKIISYSYCRSYL